jgi:hypothetical protein
VPAPDADTPAVIGERYRVEASLGRGGAAELYRVVDQASGRTLALKLLNKKLHGQMRELFELEYQTLASLEHPRTPRVFEFGSDPRGVFYTMELLEGGDLSRVAPLAWSDVCAYIRDASQALGVLHARSLIHRDVSPRNLWRTPDGRVKLIDFGALAPFGPNAQLIGTPPLVPPEALARRPLDQRADLYALGGVAYYLLTGRHAYPARTIGDLHELWREPLLPPSAFEPQLIAPGLEPIPPELDALVVALLSDDEMVRPSSTAEVIDRIDRLRGADRDSERDAAHAHLTNVAYVGRDRETRRLARRFALAARGRGQACLLESEPGGGRTRTLKHFELAARVTQACVIYANAAAEGASYGVANALALALLDTVPERARIAAEPYASLLAHLSPRLRDRLGVVASALPEVAGELRVQLQEAQRDWFLAVASERPIVLLVDGLEHADDGSIAFLLALALAVPRSRVLMLCTIERERAREQRPGLRALVNASHSMALSPLTAADMHALLQSVFGAAEHLSRLSSRLVELSGGNPGHAIELCRQLVESGAITFDSGTWLLPRELDVRGLSSTREQARIARLSRIAAPARELARLLSLHTGPLAPGLCRELATSGPDDLLPHLGELINAEILVSSGQSLLFAHEQIRQLCASELSEGASRRARVAIAEYLSASPDAGSLERLQAGVHWTSAGDPRGPSTVVRETLHIMLHEVDTLAPAAPTFEAALLAFRARGCSAYEEVVLLSALALAGYEGDLRFILEYGEPAVRTLEELCGLGLARKLQRHLGGKLGLAIALASAAVGFTIRRGNPCVPSFVQALDMLFTSAACSAGARSICFDPDASSRFAEALQPFAALGPNQPGGLMYEFCRAVAGLASDRQPESTQQLQDLFRRIEQTTLRKRVTEAQARRLRGGALFALGTLATLRDSDATLRIADELERNGLQLDGVCADQIRTLYHGSRGEMVAYDRYRRLAEHHAIARGTTWQLETWYPGPASSIALQLHDALAMKSAAEQLQRMTRLLPGIEVHARMIRGAYLLLRGKYAEAVPYLADCLQEAPRSRTAWARSHGLLARAYNRLSDHASAHAACMRVFDQYTDDDFEYVTLNLIVQTERAIAEAGLGRVEAARDQLERLHAQHDARTNPLLRGQLFEAGLEVALIAGDLAATQHQLAQIVALYRPLNIPSLAQYCEMMVARIDQLAGEPRVPVGRAALGPSAAANSSSELWSIARSRSGEKLPFAERARRALRFVANKTDASDGVLYVIDAPSPPELVATLRGEQPSPLVQRWIAERFARELEDERTLLETGADASQARWDVLHEGELNHRMLVFTTTDGVVVALAALARAGDASPTCSSILLSAIADRLYEALCDEKTDRSSVVVGHTG